MISDEWVRELLRESFYDYAVIVSLRLVTRLIAREAIRGSDAPLSEEEQAAVLDDVRAGIVDAWRASWEESILGKFKDQLSAADIEQLRVIADEWARWAREQLGATPTAGDLSAYLGARNGKIGD